MFVLSLEVVEDRLCRTVSLIDPLLEHLVHDRAQTIRDTQRRGHLEGWPLDLRAKDLRWRQTIDCAPGKQQLVGHEPQRVDIRGGRGRLVEQQLWRDVSWRPDHGVGRGEFCRAPIIIQDLGDAEVEELDLIGPVRMLVEHDVCGLDVAVEDAEGVRFLE